LDGLAADLVPFSIIQSNLPPVNDLFMSAWDLYPTDYRQYEVSEATRAVRAGLCVSVVGLSGSGKSNLLGFIAYRLALPGGFPSFVLIDCNRLGEATPQRLLRHIRTRLESRVKGASNEIRHSELSSTSDELAALEDSLSTRLAGEQNLCLLFDRFDVFTTQPGFSSLAGNLRALRDAHKYQLTYITATRNPLDASTELAELFFGRTQWLGPLVKSDALWSARRDAGRLAGITPVDWSDTVLESLVELSWGYPSFLRAAVEAYAEGTPLDSAALQPHQSVQRRLAEFWADDPSHEALDKSGLLGHPWLVEDRSFVQNVPGEQPLPVWDTTGLTAKENRLLETLQAHAGQVCEKDDLVQAVWPEDVIFTQGVRDESLAQLVRRLRVKIEPDPAAPRYLLTVPGRGYILK